MDKSGGEPEHLGCKDQYLTPDSLSATKKIGNNHVLNTNNLSEEVSLTSVGADDNMTARKVSGDDDDSVRFSDDDSDERLGSTGGINDVVSDSGEKKNASAAGYYTYTMLGKYEHIFKYNTILATENTWAELLKLILKDAHEGRAPSALGLMNVLWKKLRKQGNGMNWEDKRKTVNSFDVYTYKIIGDEGDEVYKCQMELLHHVMEDILLAEGFVGVLVRNEFPRKCTEENIAETIKYLVELTKELGKRGGEDRDEEYPDIMTLKGLPKYLCHDPEDAPCRAPPHRADEKGGRAEGTTKVREKVQSKPQKVTSNKKRESGGGLTNKSSSKKSKVGSITKDNSNEKGANKMCPGGNLGGKSNEGQGEEMLRGRTDELLKQIKLLTNEVTQLRGEVACMKGMLNNILGKMNGEGC